MGIAELAILGLFVTALAVLVAPFQRTTVRALEGYWGGSWLGGALAYLGIRIQRRRLERLRRRCYEPTDTARQERLQRVAAERLERYPAADDLLPTRLGNVLRAAERQAGERYGFDTVTVWPHLYPHLSRP